MTILKNILKKIDLKIFSKISFILLSIWILSPLLVMFLNIFNPRGYAYIILYTILKIIGLIGILIGIIYMLKNIFTSDIYKKKLDYKKYLPIFILLILLLWCYCTCFT